MAGGLNQRNIEIIRLRSEGMSMAEVAKATDATKAAVFAVLRRAGMTAQYTVRPLVFGPNIPDGAVGVQLPRGLVAIVDRADADWVGEWNWHCSAARAQAHVLRRTTAGGAKTTIWLHRAVLQAPEDFQVDHINGNPLDNRKANLRACTPQQNSWNGKQRSTIQPYKGVSIEPAAPHLWRARICVDGKLYRLGAFDKAEDAAEAYDAAAVEFFGEFARLNFPDRVPQKPAARKVKIARGEAVSGSKLDAATVIDIRRRQRSGVSVYRIAKDLGVSYNTIRSVVRGLNWRHVTEAA